MRSVHNLAVVRYPQSHSADALVHMLPHMHELSIAGMYYVKVWVEVRPGGIRLSCRITET